LLLNLLEGATQRVLEHDGEKAFENPLAAAAIHEAGHAVVAVYALGAELHRSRIWETSVNHWAGETDTTPKFTVDANADMPTIVHTFWRVTAGIAAEQTLAPLDYHEGASLHEKVLGEALNAPHTGRGRGPRQQARVHGRGFGGSAVGVSFFSDTTSAFSPRSLAILRQRRTARNL